MDHSRGEGVQNGATEFDQCQKIRNQGEIGALFLDRHCNDGENDTLLGGNWPEPAIEPRQIRSYLRRRARYGVFPPLQLLFRPNNAAAGEHGV